MKAGAEEKMWNAGNPGEDVPEETEGNPVISLRGSWKLHLDPQCSDLPPREYEDTICLPDSISHARKGFRGTHRDPGHLTDPYAFEGCMWVRREIRIPESWAGEETMLLLERTRRTALWLDGNRIGVRESLCTPHRYILPPMDSGEHVLEIAVLNVGYPTAGGHMTSPDTQTNWLGILGRMELTVLPAVRFDNVRIMKETGKDQVVFSLGATGEGFLTCRVDGGPEERKQVKKGPQRLTCDSPRPMEAWDEFSPVLHCLELEMDGFRKVYSFGIRTLETRERKLLVNGRETFLRGTHSALLYPETGYAPMDAEAWLKELRTAQEYGINHYRFHTCCPPEAAFAAADRLGIYLEPELPFWGTVAEEENDEQRYLIEEGFRILREYGNHPSFVMMSMGNELWGSRERLETILEGYHQADPNRLYTDGSNNFQFTPVILKNADFLCGVRLSRDRLYRGSYAMCDAPQGFIQTDVPNTTHCYDRIIAEGEQNEQDGEKVIQIQVGTGVKEVRAEAGESIVPRLPVISHEVGQYECYPDYREISRYTGVLKAENLALLREKAEERGLLSRADDFFRATGALAADCYKREIEAALKSKELAGFQLLDLKDYSGQGTALVGMLNPFMESKGIISGREWRQFCAPTVIMAALEKFVYACGETMEADVLLFRTDPGFHGEWAAYRILHESEVLAEGSFPITGEDRVTRTGCLKWRMPEFPEPAVCMLELSVSGTEVGNRYRFTVYPSCDIRITPESIETAGGRIEILRDLPAAVQARKAGRPCLLVPEAGEKLEGTYCTNFWNFPMFRKISESMHKPVPTGTMGCLIEKTHPALHKFPAEEYTTPDWYHIITHSHCEDLTGRAVDPIVWVIDHPSRAQKLALLYEEPSPAGEVLVCTSRLWEIADEPEVRQFALGLTRYLLGR